MTKRPLFSRLWIVGLAVGLAANLVAAAPASAQSAAAAWRNAQAREQAARKATPPVAKTLRAVATSYELIVRKYPTSGYSDNALWQAAGLLELAYQRGGARADRDSAIRLLQWLKKEYPSSSYARQVPDRVAALTPRAPAAEPAPPKADARAARPVPPATAPPAARQTPTATPAAPAPRAPTAAVTTAPAATSAVAAPTASAPSPPPVPPPAAPIAPTAATNVNPSAVPGATAVRATPLAPVVVPEVFKEFPVALRTVSHATLPRGERLILELSEEMVHAAERTTSGTQDQLTLVLRGTGVVAGVVDAATHVRGTLVRNVRVSARADGIQVRIDLAGRPRYSTFPLYDPYRIVVDFESDETPGPPAASAAAPATSASKPPVTAPVGPLPARVAATSPPQTDAAPIDDPLTRPLPPSSTRNGGYSLARQLGLGVSRVVIDPGHGGHDPGAQANGVSEAELVLDIAKRVEALLLKQPGVDVVLTRRTNDYVPLEERTAIANREKADLFLSIHANSSPQQDTRGVETYVLNFATNPHAESVAARENAPSAQAMGVLPQLVKAITLNNKLTESRELATLVQTSMVRRLSAQNKAVKDLGVKQAPFVVLIGAQMPSVLAEVSFLTNRSDAGLLKQNAHRQRIAQALCDAVLKYQSSLKKVATVAANTEER